MSFQTTRTRSSGDTSGTFLHVLDTDAASPPNVFQDYDQPTGFACGATQSISDNINKNARKRMRAGEIVMSDMSLVKWSRQFSEGVIDTGVIPNWGRLKFNGDLIQQIESAAPTPHDLRLDLENMKIVAYSAALAKLNQPGVMGGEILKDLGTTIRMLKRPFQSATELLTRMIKNSRPRGVKRWKTARDALKATADSWLELRYGWIPTLGDMEHIVTDAMSKRAHVKWNHLVVRAEERQKLDTIDATSLTYKPNAVYTGCIHTEQLLRACAGIIYDLQPQSGSDVALQALGLRLCDAPATIWEVIPYSFVVDRFVSVGQWIQAITPKPEINIRRSWITTVYNRVRTCEGGSVRRVYTDGYVGTGNSGVSIIKEDNIVRDVDPQLNITPVVFPRVTLNFKLDALALMLNPIMGMLRTMKH